MHVRILRRRYSSSRSPYARRWSTRILLFSPSTKPERDLVLRAAVGRDPLPVPLNHRGELLVGTQALPLERRPPVLEEAARPALAPVVPELAERFLEQVGGVQALVGGEQRFEGPAAAESQILAMGQQGVLLPLDEAALAPGHTRVLALADLIEGVAQMAQDMELVEQDAGPRSVARGPGVPARRSCSRMYCCSSAFTVCQSSRSSLATSRMGDARQRRPT